MRHGERMPKGNCGMLGPLNWHLGAKLSGDLHRPPGLLDVRQLRKTLEEWSGDVTSGIPLFWEAAA